MLLEKVAAATARGETIMVMAIGLEVGVVDALKLMKSSINRIVRWKQVVKRRQEGKRKERHVWIDIDIGIEFAVWFYFVVYGRRMISIVRFVKHTRHFHDSIKPTT